MRQPPPKKKTVSGLDPEFLELAKPSSSVQPADDIDPEFFELAKQPAKTIAPVEATAVSDKPYVPTQRLRSIAQGAGRDAAGIAELRAAAPRHGYE